MEYRVTFREDPKQPGQITAVLAEKPAAEPEEIKLGKPEKAQGRLRWLHWKNNISNGVVGAGALWIVGDGFSRIAPAFINGDLGSAAFGLAEMATALSFEIYSYGAWADRHDQLTQIDRSLNQTIREGFLYKLGQNSPQEKEV